MKQYKYYTPSLLADILIALLPDRKYDSVIDICCGSWNLLNAARKRFPYAKYIGIDTDEESRKWKNDDSIFICQDGRDYSINCAEKYDLIVSNPPFGNIKKDNRKYSKSTKKQLQKLSSHRYENEMILANLELSKKGGMLLLILPSTFFEGESYLEVRKQLADNFKIESIIRLPDNTFGTKGIHTYATIIKNEKSSSYNAEYIEVNNGDGEWLANKKSIISSCHLLNGEWISKHNEMDRKGIIAFRGVISSSDFDSQGEKVLHCSSTINNGEWVPSIRYCSNKDLLKKDRQADIGDAVINRIGKYAGYWTLCKEKAYISDCIIVIKKNDAINVGNKLHHNTINGKLNIITYGLTTKYITMRSILELI